MAELNQKVVKASIKSISPLGMVTVEFNSSMKPIEPITLLNSSSIGVKILKEGRDSNQSLTWTPLSFLDKTFKI